MRRVQMNLVLAMAMLCWLAGAVRAVTISNISLSSTSIPQYSKLEVTFTVTTSATKLYYPYNATDDGYAHPSGVTVEATVTLPNATQVTVPAFYYEPYIRTTDASGNEVIGISGLPVWKVRYTPATTGSYSLTLKATDASGNTTSSAQAFSCTTSSNKGFIRKAADPRFLKYDNGTDFIAIAEGRQWAPDGTKPSLSYGTSFASDHTNGINLTRIWDQNDSFNLALEGSYRRWDPQWSQYAQAVSIDTVTKRTGNRASKFNRASGAVTEGYFQKVSCLASTSYTLTGYVKTTSLTGTAFFSVDGTSSTGPGATRTNTLTGTNASFTQVTCNFTTGSTQTTLGIWAGCQSATGTAWFDDLVLTQSGQTFNLIPDPGFERQFPKGDVGNDPENATTNLTVPKGTNINQWAAYQLDQIIASAETSDIAIQLCSHGDVYWTWDAVIYTDPWAANNGYSVSMTDSRHVGYWKRNYRYRIARWGYSPAILAWEVWNEHGNISSGDSTWTFYGTSLGPWVHTTDPFKHLFTTSMGSQAYSPDFWSTNPAPIDVCNWHDYMTYLLTRHPVSWEQDESKFVWETAQNVLVTGWTAGQARKPFIWGEIGTLNDWNGTNPNATTGTGGQITRHNFIWSSLISPIFTNPIDFETVSKYAHTAPARAYFNNEPYSSKNYDCYASSDVDPPSGHVITPSNGNLRVLLLSSPDRILAWVQNKQNTWYNVVQLGNTPTAQSGNFATPSLNAGNYRVEWWNTYTGVISSQSNISHGGGALTLTLPSSITTDTAVKVINTGGTAPNAPSGLTATAVSSSQINLAWTDNSSNETQFKIERKLGAGGTYAQIGTVGANVTTYNNTGLAASTNYYYRVRANNASGDSAYSNEANATTQAGGGGTNLLTDGDFQSGTALTSGVNYTAGTTADGVWYCNSAWTKTANAGPNGTGDTAATVSNNFSDLRLMQGIAAPASGTQMTLGFQYVRPSGFASTVTVYGMTNGQVANVFAGGAIAGTQLFQYTLGTSASYATVSNQTFTLGATYTHLLLMVSVGGDAGDKMDNITLTGPAGSPPAAPTSLTATAVSSSQINLAWTDNASNETQFKIERKLGAGGTYAQIGTVGANVTTYNNTGLAASTNYYYRVRANNAGGDSAYSNEANATTQAGGGAIGLSFNGTSSKASAADSASLDIAGTAITMEAWVDLTAADAFNYMEVVGRQVISTDNGFTRWHGIGGYANGQQWKFGLVLGPTFYMAQSATNLPKNQWVHVAGSYDGANVRFFINGTVAATTAATAAVTVNNNAWNLGSNGTAEWLGGLIDEVRISNNARYTANFTPPAAAFSSDANTKALWHLQENTGTTSADSSGNSNTLTLTSTTWTTGKF